MSYYVEYFQLLKFFLFLFSFLSSEQLYYQNRTYRKKGYVNSLQIPVFLKLAPLNISPFTPLGLSARECAQQTAHIIKNETKYSSAHSKLQ